MGVPWETNPNAYLTANGSSMRADRSEIHQAVKLGWAFENVLGRLPYLHEMSGKLLIQGIGGARERGIDFDSIGYFASAPELFPSGGPQFESWFPG
jgi:hypothetical protein